VSGGDGADNYDAALQRMAHKWLQRHGSDQ